MMICAVLSLVTGKAKKRAVSEESEEDIVESEPEEDPEEEEEDSEAEVCLNIGLGILNSRTLAKGWV